MFDDDYDSGFDAGYEEGYDEGYFDRRPDSDEDRAGRHSQGCYIATCVYGSYDCPEVWTLRRFRDQVLRRSAAGRGFIRVYYAISPKMVRCFGGFAWFRKPVQAVLDRFVAKLNRAGFQNTNYRDLD